MALIQCPECGKEISDKSDRCIYCGYPIRTAPYIHENIKGSDYDLSFLNDNSMTQARQIKQIVEMTGCGLFEAKEIVLRYHPTEKHSNTPHCPTCSSTDIKKISETSKAASVVMWGIFSQKIKKAYHCNNCGYEW